MTTRPPLALLRAGLATLLAIVGLAVVTAMPASAGTIISPSGTVAAPFVVPVNNAGAPEPFTVVGSGWTPNRLVYILVCDGVSPASRDWLPDGDCDTATEPAGVKANAKGMVTFPASNSNFDLTLFRGASPQGLFNCLSPHQADPRNGLRSFRNCQIRMTENDSLTATTDAFLPIVVPDAPPGATAPGAATGSGSVTSGGTTGSAGSSSNGKGKTGGTGQAGGLTGASSAGRSATSKSSSGGSLLWLLVLVVGLVIVGAASAVLLRKRRASGGAPTPGEAVESDGAVVDDVESADAEAH
jgi:hypothetical protein